MNDEPCEHHRTNRRSGFHLVTVTAVAAIFYASGFWSSSLLHQERVRRASIARYQELLSIGVGMGFITIDEQKLDEAIAAGPEAGLEGGAP